MFIILGGGRACYFRGVITLGGLATFWGGGKFLGVATFGGVGNFWGSLLSGGAYYFPGGVASFRGSLL